ncbi:rhodanese-like domain-containing protein [Methanococcoides sp. SA1]|nr:rhodanese-like domain-containing protein [Methanococcoides sp. SA1]
MSTKNQKPKTNNKNFQEDFFLLDVRTPEEFNESHIKGSTLIPMNEIPNNLEKLRNTKQEILLICRSGARAKAVQDFLEENNITNTKVLEGGILANQHLL